MAPPKVPPVVLQVKKEVDSTRKFVIELDKYNEPPSLVEVMDINKQFET
jgi:hypothetical protein